MRLFIVLLFAALGLACLGAAHISPVPAAQRPSREPNLRESVAWAIKDEQGRLLTPQFDPAGHFFSKTTVVSISLGSPGGRIHYTVDGADPTEHSPLYTGPVVLEPEKGARCVVIRAVAVSGGQTGPVVTHSYFLDPDIRTRFSSYVFSLSTNEDNLYSREDGILVPGKRRELSEALHPDREMQAHDANYKGRGRDWERPVNVEVFSPNGERVIAQKAGLRVFGGVSRHYSQKSLRLIARKAYEPGAGKFRYPFFPELAAENLKNPIVDYDELVLSNGGQDLTDAQIRTPLASRIAAEAGYPWVAPVNSAAVYINGDYYGHAFLTTRVNDSFLSDMFDAPRDDFIIMKGGVKELFGSPKQPDMLRWRDIRDFRELTRRCGQGVADEKLFADMRRLVDIDGLLLYYALEIYLDNRDWLDDQNNTKVWRYSDDASDELDGRWRYILYDLDATAMSPWHGAKPPSNPTLERALKESPLFGALMRRPEFAGKFANHVCDMAFAHFTEANARRVMEDLDRASLKEIRHAARHGVYSPPDLLETIRRGRENTLAFFRERPEHALRQLRETFGYTGLFQVIVEGPAKLNTVSGDNPQGWYFSENSVTLVPAFPPGKALKRWEVNGRPRQNGILELTARDAVAGVIRVKLIGEDRPSPLTLEAAYDHGRLCGFDVRNVTDGILNAEGLYLSDRADKPRKWPITGITFAPGEVAHFVGKGHRHADALHRLKVNFNPRRGETVYLRDRSGTILSSIVVQ
ncbi:MAG: CotH kinase family protein [Desulfovibrio sp.]|jgi:hypothetical protein|nr:CotH kinase family protein [Desulfovibrio sp.]